MKYTRCYLVGTIGRSIQSHTSRPVRARRALTKDAHVCHGVGSRVTVKTRIKHAYYLEHHSIDSGRPRGVGLVAREPWATQVSWWLMGRLVPEWDKEWPCCVTEAEEMASLTPDRALSLTHTPLGRERDSVG